MFQMRQRLDPEVVARRLPDYEALGLNTENIPFTLEDMQISLRKQDITPYWWDKLLAISYKTITRVDVRRFAKLGLIDRDELVFRYRELGYSPADAELMTKFTEQFNAASSSAEDDETRDLTKAQILNFFEEGRLDRDNTISMLSDIGYSEAASINFVELRALDALRESQRLEIKTITTRFESGLATFNETVTALDALTIPAQLRDSIMARVQAEEASRVRLPSRAELDAFIDESIITGGEYQVELIRLGYPRAWAQRFRLLHDRFFRDNNVGLLVNPSTGERDGTDQRPEPVSGALEDGGGE